MLSPNGQYRSVRLTSTGYVKGNTNTTSQCSGLLGGFIVASGSGSISIYDSNNTTNGILLLNNMTIADATPYPFPVLFTRGCYVVITGTMDVTFFYE